VCSPRQQTEYRSDEKLEPVLCCSIPPYRRRRRPHHRLDRTLFPYHSFCTGLVSGFLKHHCPLFQFCQSFAAIRWCLFPTPFSTPSSGSAEPTIRDPLYLPQAVQNRSKAHPWPGPGLSPHRRGGQKPGHTTGGWGTKKSGPRCGESIHHPFPVLCCSPANQARWSRPVPVLEPAGAAGKDREDCVRAGTVCNLTIRACVFPRTKRLASARQAEPPQICFCPPRAGMIPAGRARTSFAEHACPLTPLRCRVCIASGVGWEPAQLRYGCSCGISAMGFLQMMAIASAFRISLVGGIEKRGMGWQQQGRVDKEGRGRFPGHSLTAMT